MSETTEPILLNDVSFKTIDGESSIKTNFLVHSNNWKTAATYLNNLKNFIVELTELINIENLLAQITSNFYKSKTLISVNATLNVTESFNVEQNGVNYFVIKTNDYVIKISNADDASWISDRLMIQVKRADGVIVYPFIKTKDNEILIQFNDKIATDYNIILI